MNHILKMMVMFNVSVAVYDGYCNVQSRDTSVSIGSMWLLPRLVA